LFVLAFELVLIHLHMKIPVQALKGFKRDKSTQSVQDNYIVHFT